MKPKQDFLALCKKTQQQHPTPPYTHYYQSATKQWQHHAEEKVLLSWKRELIKMVSGFKERVIMEENERFRTTSIIHTGSRSKTLSFKYNIS